MSFEFCEAGQAGFGMDPLPEGQCSISKQGKLRCHKEDLELVDIEHYAAVLADPSNMRIGLRVPRDEERRGSVAVSTVLAKGGRDTGRRELNVGPGLRRLRVTAPAVAGRYSLQSHGDMIYVRLTDAPVQVAPAGAGKGAQTK